MKRGNLLHPECYLLKLRLKRGTTPPEDERLEVLFSSEAVPISPPFFHQLSFSVLLSHVNPLLEAAVIAFLTSLSSRLISALIKAISPGKSMARFDRPFYRGMSIESSTSVGVETSPATNDFSRLKCGRGRAWRVGAWCRPLKPSELGCEISSPATCSQLRFLGGLATTICPLSSAQIDVAKTFPDCFLPSLGQKVF